MRKRALPWLCGALATTVLLLSPSLASAATHTCKGTFENPGVLSGSYGGDVRVEGVCAVNAGPAVVRGSVTIRPGAALAAAFGLNNSGLTVRGNIRLQRGASAFLGCDPNSPCIDEPNQNSPTLTSATHLRGSLTEESPLGIIVHNSTIDGNVVEHGGGGGLTCEPTGIFRKFMSPAYSDYENSSIGGTISVTDLRSCWMGIIRNHVGKSLRLIDNRFADPDAIEILSNHIRDDLACFRNSMVWDSADASPTGALYPRTPEPNTVDGKRLGQCELASPPTDSSPPGPGPF